MQFFKLIFIYEQSPSSPLIPFEISVWFKSHIQEMACTWGLKRCSTPCANTKCSRLVAQHQHCTCMSISCKPYVVCMAWLAIPDMWSDVYKNTVEFCFLINIKIIGVKSRILLYIVDSKNFVVKHWWVLPLNPLSSYDLVQNAVDFFLERLSWVLCPICKNNLIRVSW